VDVLVVAMEHDVRVASTQALLYAAASDITIERVRALVNGFVPW
jgi:hypothetical protein